MDTWTRVGTVSAAIAAVGGVGAVGVSWYYGKRNLSESDQALRYERLREARELVSEMRVAADNTYFDRANEAGARLRAVLLTLPGDYPATRKLAETEWNLDAYREQNLQGSVAAARTELETAVAALTSG